MRRRRNEDNDEKNPRGAQSVNQNAVYFECEVCGHRFQDDPNQDFVECPQCGSDETMRV
jgi:rubrerythrin